MIPEHLRLRERRAPRFISSPGIHYISKCSCIFIHESYAAFGGAITAQPPLYSPTCARWVPSGTNSVAAQLEDFPARTPGFEILVQLSAFLCTSWATGQSLH